MNDVEAYLTFVYALFECRKVCGLAILHSDNAYTNVKYASTSFINNDTFTILIGDFSKE
jgi:hypothetical protein